MALLKSLNDSCLQDIDARLSAVRVKRALVAANKARLKQQAKAELTRPGSIAAAFTAGVLVVPDSDQSINREETPGKADATAPEALRERQAAHTGEESSKGDKLPFDPLDILGSVISTVIVRALADRLSHLLPTAAEKADSADADSATGVELGH